MIDLKRVAPFFENEGIELYALLPFSSCTVIHENLLARSLPEAKSVLIFAVPYYAGDFPTRNISLYAIAKDYHLYLSALHKRLIAFLKERYPDGQFVGFGDHSPIAERHAAASAGLGILGDNGMLIHEKYGSYLFIGEVLTDLETDSCPKEILHCPSCGRCKEACPGHFSLCASGIGQKKGILNAEEEKMVLETGLVWGCDRCQVVCPFNRAPKITPISFFKKDLLPRITAAEITGLSKEAFSARAFGWRGKQPVLRNLKLFDEVEK